MLTIIIVSLFCFILYKTGKAAAMLEHFRLYPETVPAETATAAPSEVFQDPPELERKPTPDRLRLEAVAMNILLYKGIETAPAKVKKLSDSELNKIIELFKNDL